MADFNSTESQEALNDKKKMGGYRIAIAILAVVLVGLSALYLTIHSQQKADYELLSSDRDAVQQNLTEIIVEFEAAKTNNDELKVNMEIERHRADSIITQLKKERTLNYSKLRQYEREANTLRNAMRGYLKQIDSLNNLNQELLSQNVDYKKQITSTELRAKKAEELAAELDNQVRKGALLIAQNIELLPLNKRGREISRVKRAPQLSVNFSIAANKLAKPGNRTIYARITSPDGYVLTTEKLPTFTMGGEKVSYSSSREIDYQNKGLDVSIFFDGEGFVAGTYGVELYTDGASIGSAKLEMR